LSPVHDHAQPGLRERKKARTRTTIQAVALDLFERQGYGATTVDQIAALAEVSQSTFFRYFPTKEAVVLHDRYDPLLLAAFRAQPAQLSPIAALRATLRSVLGTLPAQELAHERQRAMLIVSVQELRAVALDQLVGTLVPFAEAVAERTRRTVEDRDPATRRRPLRADRRRPRAPRGRPADLGLSGSGALTATHGLRGRKVGK
jgi:AcrR family transcriptional regulator